MTPWITKPVPFNIGQGAAAEGGDAGLTWNTSSYYQAVFSDSDKTVTGTTFGVWTPGSVTSEAITSVSFTVPTQSYVIFMITPQSTYRQPTSPPPWGNRYGWYFQGAGGGYDIERANFAGSMSPAQTRNSTDVMTITTEGTASAGGIRLLKNDVEIDDYGSGLFTGDVWGEPHLNGDNAITSCTLV